MQYLFGALMFITSIFLILLVLVQRGRGGGLAGAFGGMGGQSAFGTKAGDLFTRITIVVAAFWFLLSVTAIKVLNQSQSVFGEATTRPPAAAGTPDTRGERPALIDETEPEQPDTGTAPTGGTAEPDSPAATNAEPPAAAPADSEKAPPSN